MGFAAHLVRGLVLALALAAPVRADPAAEVLQTWYKLVLELVRHTPTYSPPVASRAFGYLGVTAYEATALGRDDMLTLAGQVNGLAPLDIDATGTDPALVLQAALAPAVAEFFANTGPTGQRAMAAMTARMDARVEDGLSPEVIAASRAAGAAVAAHISAWAATDGGAVVENMGFPLTYTPRDAPDAWVPTSRIVQQQAPLLPHWGENRPFAMPDGASCPLPPPPAYSEEPGSAFHAEAMEVYQISQTLTDEQKLIARFWSDDPMLSPTPPGHWIFLTLGILQAEGADAARSADILARLGMGLADAFIGCWDAKSQYDLLRPVTYIRRVIDPDWAPLLITPPFPEYPSGHSTQSGAAATVLTAFFGEGHAFDDATHSDDGLPIRSYPDFWTAAEEAARSRLYGGIHFRAAIDQGLAQGRCIGAHVTAIRTRP